MSAPDPSSLPCGPLEETKGLKYFPRMVGKIRLQAAGQLWAELQANLGKGSDATCAGFLHINYEALSARVLEGGSDADLLTWCEENGRPLQDADRLVWNAYISKLGWNDHITPMLLKRKADSGLSDREDIQTMSHYIDIDEGRRA